LDFIFIHSAPGTGKSTLACALQHHLQGPCFEFGWIPEFCTKREGTITWKEEALAFENLTLVVKITGVTVL
jgi:broad-specificity NMP kinase